jgi:hypothetical protein
MLEIRSRRIDLLTLQPCQAFRPLDLKSRQKQVHLRQKMDFRGALAAAEANGVACVAEAKQSRDRFS